MAAGNVRRVLHLLPYLEAGGTERAVHTLVKSLPGWQSKVLAPPGSWEEPFRELGCLELISGSFSESLKRVAAAWQPDLLHIHGASHFFFAAGKTGLPIVFTGHGYPTKFDYWLASKLCNRWARQVISVSRAEEKSFLACGLDRKKSTVIHNGIFKPEPNPARARALAQKLGLDLRRPLIATAVRLVPDKGCTELIEALSLISPKPQLVLAGTGPMAGKLKEQVRQLNLGEDVILPGFLEHPEALLLLAQVAVLPSRREAIGLFLLEAMAMGKAIVATEVGGIPEALGDCGLLVPARDPVKLAETVEMLLADSALRRKLGERSMDRWQKAFSASRMGEVTAALYERVLAC